MTIAKLKAVILSLSSYTDTQYISLVLFICSYLKYILYSIYIDIMRLFKWLLMIAQQHLTNSPPPLSPRQTKNYTLQEN